jgi:hypothetical protein
MGTGHWRTMPAPASRLDPEPSPTRGRAGALPWPLPALGAWLLAWAVFVAVRGAGMPVGWAALAALLVGVALAYPIRHRWRRLLVAAGFPASAALTGWATEWPPWIWLLALTPLVLLYPLRTWRDAPWFPTPGQALSGLETLVVPPPQRVLDVGCGLGHGLQALGRLWPRARLHGIEWSRPLAWLAARRCRFADVRRGDMWRADWSGHDLVYVFQRPESMARAWAKAEAELAPGSWLASLEFAVPGRLPDASLQVPGRRPVWLYRVGAKAAKLHSTGVATGR